MCPLKCILKQVMFNLNLCHLGLMSHLHPTSIVLTRRKIMLNTLASQWLGTPMAWNVIAFWKERNKNVHPSALQPKNTVIFLPQKYFAVSSSKARRDSCGGLLSKWKMVQCKRSRGWDANNQGTLTQAFDRNFGLAVKYHLILSCLMIPAV